MKTSSVKNHLLLASAITIAVCNAASAEIYKHVDENGHITYTNIKSKGATRLDIDPDANVIKNDAPRISSKSNASSRTATPSTFPKVDKETQANRDGKRGEILRSELEAEMAALDQAKKAYTEGEANPEIAHQADGKTYRNVAKFNEKMKNLQADVDAHENNVKLLQRELDSLK